MPWLRTCIFEKSFVRVLSPQLAGRRMQSQHLGCGNRTAEIWMYLITSLFKSDHEDHEEVVIHQKNDPRAPLVQTGSVHVEMDERFFVDPD